MPFQRFVEVGRVAYVASGPLKGKLVAIVDVIDQTRVLIDGPETGVPRQQIRINEIHLTKFKVTFPHSARTKVVRKAWIDGEVQKKWEESKWCKRAENSAKRREMNDYDRFKLRGARRHRNYLRTTVYRRVINKNIKSGCFRKVPMKNSPRFVKIRKFPVKK
ncbi:60S ribosomal protein L14 isoform X3 [Thrips palmi]|uniref:Large ribosomal subunit protein eL14 n=1 Tax=Thrips palmi TaxID=161013 RepID=A0A6P9AKG5_THRPL|nr:60S ribosomal protein L14 isoform X2 [Thrips palmi]XP_034255972.1 60S ribosomal protein L14 isoform X3 [Thrips palmi]